LPLHIEAAALGMRIDANEAARFSLDGLQGHFKVTLPAEARIVQPSRKLSRDSYAAKRAGAPAQQRQFVTEISGLADAKGERN
jgi:hypothetical protein